jgi:hypothetical protein
VGEGGAVILDSHRRPLTKNVQGWPKLWASFRDLIGILSQIVGPNLAIWANPVQFWFRRFAETTTFDDLHEGFPHYKNERGVRSEGSAAPPRCTAVHIRFMPGSLVRTRSVLLCLRRRCDRTLVAQGGTVILHCH